MPVMRTAFAPVQEPILDQRHWELLHGERGRMGVAKFASASKISTSRFLLSHVTIMASCAMEPAPYSYLIRPESSHLVNNNHDFWPNEVLRLSFHTFRGSFNFVEHYQNTKASKGTIVDAILRKVRLGPDHDLFAYYVDLLVATGLEHEELVGKIRSGAIKYLSMGCLTDIVFCSFCSASGDGSSAPCIHLLPDLGFKGRFKPDQWGIPRRIAEGCGSADLPGGGVRFVEASWVGTPAFPGAFMQKILSDEWELPDNFMSAAHPKAASLLLPPSCTAKAASGLASSPSLIATPAAGLLTSPYDRPEPRVLSELRRLR
jgi:hypothetical protein